MKRNLKCILVTLLVTIGGVIGGWQLLLFSTRPAIQQMPTMVHDRLLANGGTYVPLSKIPLMLQKAVVATEDKSFWNNLGIDPTGIVRSLIADISSGNLEQGGSTITQQLARNMLLNPQKTAGRKIKEILLALVITHYYSKEDILEMYLNEIYLGHGAYGIERAAIAYFKIAPESLTPAQCVMLAGLPRAPSIYDPLENYKAARDRQRQVLDSMVLAGSLSSMEADQIFAQPLGLAG